MTPHKQFTRSGNDLRVQLPVRISELVLGATVSVPTLEGSVGVKIPPNTTDGRTLRVRGRGVPKRSGGAGDLLVTVKVAVPNKLDEAAVEAMRAAQRRTETLYDFARKIASATTTDDVLWAAAAHIARTLECHSLILMPDATCLKVHRTVASLRADHGVG